MNFVAHVKKHLTVKRNGPLHKMSHRAFSNSGVVNPNYCPELRVLNL